MVSTTNPSKIVLNKKIKPLCCYFTQKIRNVLKKPHFGLILWRIAPPSQKKYMSLHAVVTSNKTPEKGPYSEFCWYLKNLILGPFFFLAQKPQRNIFHKNIIQVNFNLICYCYFMQKI